MKKYKPDYLGKVIPVGNPPKMNKFLTDKYESFSKIYDAVKSESEHINDIKVVNDDDDSKSLSIKISADKDTVNKIKDKSTDTDGISIDNDVITSK
jgi:hypothetical protein